MHVQSLIWSILHDQKLNCLNQTGVATFVHFMICNTARQTSSLLTTKARSLRCFRSTSLTRSKSCRPLGVLTVVPSPDWSAACSTVTTCAVSSPAPAVDSGQASVASETPPATPSDVSSAAAAQNSQISREMTSDIFRNNFKYLAKIAPKIFREQKTFDLPSKGFPISYERTLQSLASGSQYAGRDWVCTSSIAVGGQPNKYRWVWSMHTYLFLSTVRLVRKSFTA